jgi:hypothetical protein
MAEACPHELPPDRCETCRELGAIARGRLTDAARRQTRATKTVTGSDRRKPSQPPYSRSLVTEVCPSCGGIWTFPTGALQTSRSARVVCRRCGYSEYRGAAERSRLSTDPAQSREDVWRLGETLIADGAKIVGGHTAPAIENMEVYLDRLARFSPGRLLAGAFRYAWRDLGLAPPLDRLPLNLWLWHCEPRSDLRRHPLEDAYYRQWLTGRTRPAAAEDRTRWRPILWFDTDIDQFDERPLMQGTEADFALPAPSAPGRPQGILLSQSGSYWPSPVSAPTDIRLI